MRFVLALALLFLLACDQSTERALAALDKRCAAQRECAEFGHCVWRRNFDPNGGFDTAKCGPSASGCSNSDLCSNLGRCGLRDGATQCEALRDSHCEFTMTCRLEHKCRALGGECR